MIDLREAFDTRVGEIDAYLDFLSGVETVLQSGTPRLGDHGPVITAAQQRILYSSVYFQLYNLVESTITRCLDAVCAAAMHEGCESARVGRAARRRDDLHKGALMSLQPRLLMPPEEGATLKAAARRFKLSVDTIRRLYRAHGIGRQSGPGAPIIVSMPALMMLQHGDMEALSLLRSGQRCHPAVERYLRVLGSFGT